MRDHWEKGFPRVLKEEIRQFATAIGDHNPIHHDENAAIAGGLNGIIAPGVMVMGFVSSTIAEEIPGVMILEIQSKFKKPLYAGASPIVFCTKTQERGRVVYADFEIRNGTKEKYVCETCTLLLPQH